MDVHKRGFSFGLFEGTVVTIAHWWIPSMVGGHKSPNRVVFLLQKDYSMGIFQNRICVQIAERGCPE